MTTDTPAATTMLASTPIATPTAPAGASGSTATAAYAPSMPNSPTWKDST